ncbi:alpha/beta hydrolase [Niabella aquatica]
MHMKQILLYLLLTATFFSCSKDDDFRPDEPKADAAQEKNVKYGSNSLQTLDYYLPANRSATSTKVIILIHGGAWADGDKGDASFQPVVDSIRKRLPDWAIFNLNYRLATVTGGNRFPAQEEDIKTAVQYIYDRRQTFGVSDKWVLAGASAGAHLALLQAYKYNTPIKPKAVIDFFGPADMAALYNWSDAATKIGLGILLNGTPTGNPTMYYNSSPVNYVSAAPPTIILQGGLDDTVPKEQSEALRDKLAAQGTIHEYILYPNQTHGWSDPAIWYDCLNKVQSFLSVNVP